MAQKVREVMTPEPVTLTADQPVAEAANAMKQHAIGDVIVLKDGKMCGVVTDRDLVVRVMAENMDPKTAKIGEVCSRDLHYVKADDDTERAIQIMREHAVRRLPVVDGDQPIGIISIGDLALERDDRSALADISAAPPNH